jgi:hypothetical protein
MATEPLPLPFDEEPGAVLCTVCRLGVAKTTEMIIHEGQPVHPACFERQQARRSPTRHEAILRLLAERRGEMLCGECIANALSLPAKRAYAAALKIEGAGARRAHRVCTICRRPRLVSWMSP